VNIVERTVARRAVSQSIGPFMHALGSLAGTVALIVLIITVVALLTA
jgi:hypothetical protein